MRNVFHGFLAGLVLVLLLTAATSTITGCDEAVDRLSDALYPTLMPEATTSPVQRLPTQVPTTVDARPSSLPTLVPTLTSAPTSTPTLPPTETPTPALVAATVEPAPTTEPTMQARSLALEQQLLFAQEGSLYRGDFYGADAVEVAEIPQLDAWDLFDGHLAVDHGVELDVIDLANGTYQIFAPTFGEQIELTRILWGATGRALLHVALIVDGGAETFNRSALLRALSAEDGQLLGEARVVDVSDVSVLYYDDIQGVAAVVSRGPEPTFSEIEFYDLVRGELVGAFPVEGEGDLLMSPDGQQVLTQRFTPNGAELLLYDLGAGGAPQVWRHPEGSHSVSHAWSPDGRQVAFLLREGATYGVSSTRALGLWVLELASMKASRILKERAGSSSLVGWTPGGDYVVGYHRGQGEDRYFYLVRPDGGDRRILVIAPQAQILGWMPAVHRAVVPKVVIDPWTARFAEASGDAGETVELLAEVLAKREAGTSDVFLARLREYLHLAGWQVSAIRPSLRPVADDTLLVQLPPAKIYLVEPRHSQTIATGDLIIDAQRVGDELGLIYGMVGPTFVQPNYALYRRESGGIWQVLWTPQGQRAWIATDGDIRFVGEGLQAIEVFGTSFGLDAGEERIFDECRTCPHRQLSALWVREADRYVRQTSLPEDAPLADVIWEMTEPTPYSVLYEVLWRLRQGLSVDSLVADDAVVVQCRQHGLLEDDVRLVPEQELADGVRFGQVGGAQRFYARVENGRLQYVEQVSE